MQWGEKKKSSQWSACQLSSTLNVPFKYNILFYLCYNAVRCLSYLLSHFSIFDMTF